MIWKRTNSVPIVGTTLIVFALASGPSHAELVGLSTRTDVVYSIDSTTGIATPISAAGGNYAGVGLSYLGGELFASDLLLQLPPPDWDVQTARIDLDTGTSTPIGMQDGSLNWHGLASDEALGLLYSIALDEENQPLKAMTPSGVVSTIGAGTGIDGRGLAFDDANRILYALNSGDESLYSVDVGTGVAQRIGSLGPGIDTSHSGLAYDEINKILYLNGGVDNVAPLIGNLYFVNVNTGLTTLIGSNGIELIDGLAWIDTDMAPILNCSGFFPPFDDAISLKNGVKRAIPISLILTDADGFTVTDADISAPPVVNVLFNGTVFGDVPPDDAELLPLGWANEDNIMRFDPTADLWAYNLGTKQFAAVGSYTVMVASGDPSEYIINFPDGACLQTFERLP